MRQNRTWTDPKAEAEFWGHMERLEAVSARLSAMGRWGGLLSGGPFRRAALQRDLDALRSLAESLVERHTVQAGEVSAPAPERQAATEAATPSGDPLRALAGMVVSLRQDRVARPEAGEEKTV